VLKTHFDLFNIQLCWDW